MIPARNSQNNIKARFLEYGRIGRIAMLLTGLSGLARAQQGTVYDATLSPSYRGYVHDTRLWIPNNVSVIKGVIIIGNGALGDQRNRTAETDWQALARAHDFAVMGTSLYICQSVNDVNAEVPMLLADLAWYATASGHPEVTNLPFVLCGWSGGGQIAYGINFKIPERVIAYEVNKGGFYIGEPLSAAALKTPAIYVAGQVDSGTRIANITKLFDSNRPSGGRCSLAFEQNTGHAEGNVNAMFFTFFDHAIRARYPVGVTPLSGPVTLLDLSETNGWLAAKPNVSTGLSGSVFPYADYPGTKTTAGWLMDADVANLYRGFATYNPAVTVAPVGGPLFSAPQTIQFKVSVDSTAFPGWVTADVYDGAVKLGTVNKGGSMSVYAVRPWGGRDVTVIARDASGNERTSIPQPFVVNKNAAAAWNNSAGDFLWNTGSTNWGGAVWTPGADAVFSATGVGTVTVSGTQTLADSLTSLCFDTAGYKLTGGTLSLPPGTSGFNVNADAEIASVIAGAGNLIKSGTGTLTLTGGNTYYGATTVNSGTLKLGNGGRLGSNTYVSSTLAIAQNANGTSNALTGYLTLYPGANFTMADAYTSTFNVNNSATLSYETGAPPVLTFDMASANQTSDTLAISGGATVGATLPMIVTNFLAAPSVSTKTYTLITAASGLGGAAKFNLATKNFMIGGNPYHTSLATSTDTAVILSFEAGAAILPFYWQGSIDGSWKSQNGGTLNTNFTNEAAGATNTLAMPSWMTNVAMTASSASNLATTLDQAFAINGLTFVGTGSSNTAGTSIGAGSGGTLQINGGGITVNAGSGANTISAPVTVGAAQSWTNNSGNPLTIGTGSINNGGFLLTVAGSGNTTISGALGGNGGLTQSASGTLTLSGSNTYTGATTINTGMLSLTGSGTIGSGTVNLVGGTLDLGTLNITNPFSLQGGLLQNGKITLTSGNYDIQSGTAAWNSYLYGSAGLIKTTSGTASLVGTNLYTGPTTIYAGTLSIGWWGSLASTSVVNLVGGTLDLNGVGVSNGYPLIAPVSLQGGTVQNGVVNYNGSTIDIQSGTETLTAVFAGYGGLNKTSPGTATLAGTNTYTGLTTVTAGTLQLDGSIAGNVTVQAGGRLTGSGTIGGNLTVANGGIAQFTDGTFAVNGSITNNGLVILSNGAHFTGTSSSFVNNGTLDIINAGTFTPPPGFQNNGVILDSSAVRVASVSKSGNTFTVRINSNTGHTYQLQYSPTLTGGTFTNIGAPQSGSTGTTLVFTDPAATGSRGFYRVVVTP